MITKYVDVEGNEIDPAQVDDSLGYWKITTEQNPDVEDVVDDDFYDKVQITFKNGFYCQFRADMEPLLVQTDDGYEWDTENDPQHREVDRIEIAKMNALGSMTVDIETDRLIEVHTFTPWSQEELESRKAKRLAMERNKQVLATALQRFEAVEGSVANLDAEQETYADETDTALFDLDAAQAGYETETDQALFDLVNYIAELEARIEELEASNG